MWMEIGMRMRMQMRMQMLELLGERRGTGRFFFGRLGSRSWEGNCGDFFCGCFSLFVFRYG